MKTENIPEIKKWLQYKSKCDDGKHIKIFWSIIVSSFTKKNVTLIATHPS